MTATTVFPPEVGVPVQIVPLLTCVLAPNPSPMTAWGTNTYILGSDPVAVIDPGPDDARHLAALLAAIGARKVSHILVTHSHVDHSPLARPLARAVEAPVLAFGDSLAGRSVVMRDLAERGLAGGGEGVDPAFAPDQTLPDGAVIQGSWGELRALHTPGHMGNHLCFLWGTAVFTGDHVMGWSSSLVSPPDGDLTDFMRSCARLSLVDAEHYYPAHGAPVTDPRSRLQWLIAHRNEREAQILDALRGGGARLTDLTRKVYTDLTPGLLPVAARNVFAHLVDLQQKGLVRAEPHLSYDAVFARDP